MTLFLSACPFSLKPQIEAFGAVQSLYSSFYPLPPAHFPFSLRYETLGKVPWNEFSRIVAVGGSRLCSLAGELGRFHGLPALLALPHHKILACQKPDAPLLCLPETPLTPACSCPQDPAFLSRITPHAFDDPALSQGFPQRSREIYRSGECCDLASVACSEDTSSASSSEALSLDLRSLAPILVQNKGVSLQRLSPLFMELKWKGKRLMIYRQGRVSLNPCAEAEEVFFAYQYFLHS